MDMRIGRNPGSRSRGFTLVEVLVALTVLSVGLLAVAALFPSGTRKIRSAKKTSAATYAAQQLVEQVRALPKGDAGLNAGRHPAAGYTTYADEPTLSTQYTIADLTGTLSGMKSVTVVARWQEATANSVQVQTYVRPQ
jgi:type IV pilus assembly protein PilV